MAAVKKYGAEASVAETTNRRTPASATDTQPRSSGSQGEAKTTIEEKLKAEPGLESKDIQVTLTHFSVFAASGALDFLDTCHQILTKTTLVYATIRASRYDAR